MTRGRTCGVAHVRRRARAAVRGGRETMGSEGAFERRRKELAILRGKREEKISEDEVIPCPSQADCVCVCVIVWAARQPEPRNHGGGKTRDFSPRTPPTA